MSQGLGPLQRELLAMLTAEGPGPRTAAVGGDQLPLPAHVYAVAALEEAMAQAQPFVRTDYTGIRVSGPFRHRFASALQGLLRRGHLVPVLPEFRGAGWRFVDVDPAPSRSTARAAQPRFVRWGDAEPAATAAMPRTGRRTPHA